MNGIMSIIFIMVPIIAICIIIFTIVMMFSSKLRGKMMSKQIESMKHMLNDSKDDLADMAGVAIDIKKNMLDENQEVLKDLKTREANISKDSIEITAKAIKDGFSSDKEYCKHCGTLIDRDSKFCKKCGKEQ